MHILPYSQWSIYLLLILAAALIWSRPAARKNACRLLASPRLGPGLAIAETAFALALLFWAFARGLKPELDSLEKFMNVGFMNSLWRTSWLPGLDMWFAGGKINYYYYGHFFYTWLAKAAWLRPELAYNLALASTFALSLALSFTAGSRLILLWQKSNRHISNKLALAAGALSAFLVNLAGNGHAFFYSEKGPGRAILLKAQQLGLIQGTADTPYWFADATRFIGYNPDTADKTIHEFPFYSFLVADLHAHLINLAFVLLFLILLIELAGQSKFIKAAAQCRLDKVQFGQADDQAWHRLELAALWQRSRLLLEDSRIWLCTLLLAVFMMGNYWDFAIYLVALALGLLLLNQRGFNSKLQPAGFLAVACQMVILLLPYLLISQPLLALLAFAAALLLNNYLTILQKDALTLTGAQVTWVFFSAHLLALPFNLSFEPISKSLARTLTATPLWQLIILWGPHLLAGLVFCLVLFLSRRQRSGLVNPADRLVLVLFGWAICLLALPELVYVVDIYSGDFKRANTMFKFTYQAFVLLGLVWAYAVVRLAQTRHKHSRLAALLLCLLLIIPAWYPLPASRQWLGRFKSENYRGLDGLTVLATKDSAWLDGPAGQLAPDLAAINWLNENVQGQPVILESFGESYTDYCRISAFTGLPTVLGWETHEWLWRTSKSTPEAYLTYVLPRQDDIRQIYTSPDEVLRQELLDRYQVEYLVIGGLERARFNQENGFTLQEEQLLASGTLVFSQDDFFIIKLER